MLNVERWMLDVSPMTVPDLRSPHVKTGGLVYFARMLDKIRRLGADSVNNHKVSYKRLTR
jgi:hypothetical protein